MLPAWVSHCEVNDRTVFLDVKRNRYSAMKSSLAHALVQGDFDGLPDHIVRQVDEWGWRVERGAAPTTRVSPVRAVRELSSESVGIAVRPKLVYRALKCVAASRLRLKTRRLAGVLDRISAENASSAGVPSLVSIAELAEAFDATERVIFGANDCLVRSIALHRLLTNHGHQSALIFGVRLNPFRAHCWLQISEMVVNDTIEQTSLYQPVRVVQ